MTLALIGALLTILPSFAVHAPGGDFELDGNVASGTPTPPFDWTDFLQAGLDGPAPGYVTEKPIPLAASEAGFMAVGASPDHYAGGADLTTFTQGSKDTLDVSDWTCTRKNNVGNKVDITNAYSAAQRNEDGDLIIYFGTEIREPEGNSNIGMWFLKNEDVGCEAPATGSASRAFDGQHELGDVLVVSAFTNGGRVANISVYEWVGSGGSHGALNLEGDFQNVACDVLTGVDDVACAIANSGTVTTPWHSPGKTNVDQPLAVNTFFEGGVNISQVLATSGPEDECFTQFLANTRSSQSLTATIFDYTSDELEICGGLTIIKETDPEEADVDFDFTIEGGSFVDETFTLNASDEVGSEPDRVTYTDLFAGEYTITEVDIPADWDLEEIDCDGGSPAYDVDNGEVVVTVGVDASITCTFTNKQRGSVLFEKTYETDPLENEAAEFTLWHEDDVDFDGDDDPIEPEEDGTVMGLTTLTIEEEDRHFYCTDDLFVDENYWIFETEVPTGFEEVEPFSLEAIPGTCEDRLEEPDPQVVVTNEPGPVTIAVTKYKLDTDTALPGFAFSLYDGHDADPEEDTASDTAVTQDGSGDTTLGVALFEDLDLGDYTVCETGQPNDYWSEADPQCQNVTLDLEDVEDGVVALEFENEPLAQVEIIFTDHTGYTTVAIDCGDAGDLDRTDYGAGVVNGGDGSLDLDKLPLGEYDCTINIQNGADHEEEPNGPVE